ncbi:hypothetical protein QEP66_26655 [Streptomyces sp. LB8]|nr:SUKH-4 family immunity protein [Streptomyces sp. LB8]MDN5385605.1 hypothetical protein [Streptomyces sp. LB8]
MLLHRDLSSLVYSVTELERVMASLPEGSYEDEDFLESLAGTLECLKEEITRRDPHPFSSEHSEWVEIFTGIGLGWWAVP